MFLDGNDRSDAFLFIFIVLLPYLSLAFGHFASISFPLLPDSFEIGSLHLGVDIVKVDPMVLVI
jgi:hypothetical protein